MTKYKVCGFGGGYLFETMNKFEILDQYNNDELGAFDVVNVIKENGDILTLWVGEFALNWGDVLND